MQRKGYSVTLVSALAWAVVMVSLLTLSGASILLAQPTGSWQTTGATNIRQGVGAPAPRNGMAGVWMGDSLFVFGGSVGTAGYVNTGGIYSVPTDSWLNKPNLIGGVGAPSVRSQPFAVWTGSVVIVWGGSYLVGGGGGMRSDGAIYDPATDTWTLHSGLQAPAFVTPAYVPNNNGGGLSAWRDGRMVVFGGSELVGQLPYTQPAGVYTGGIFDLATGNWVPAGQLSVPIPPEQFRGAPVFTGTSIIARADDAGAATYYPQSNGITASSGDVFDLSSMTWLNNPVIRSGVYVPKRHNVVAVWSGEYRIEWGGAFTIPPMGSLMVSDGNIYDPIADQFLQQAAMTGGLTGYERIGHQMVWTGRHMFVWGGRGMSPPSGGILPPSTNAALYDPVAGAWLTGGALDQTSDWPSPRSDHLLIQTGDRVLVFGGGSASGQTNFNVNTGGVYIPPRSAPVIRNLDPGEPGTSTNPLIARAGEKFRHRIVCYGCPEAVLASTNLPSWLHIGWGGPSGLGPSPGTTGFVPWFSADGGTADGQWLRGTPGVNDVGLHSFDVIAANGVSPATASHTVWIKVQGPPKITSTVGSAYGPRLTAIEGAYWSYLVQTVSEPGPVTFTATGLPSWMSFTPSAGYLEGTPTAAHINTSSTITITATNSFAPPSGSGLSNTTTQIFTITVVRPQPLSASVADLNQDSIVDVVDIQLLVNWMVSATPTPPPTTAVPVPGDVNGDSTADVVDVQALINFILRR